MKKVYLMMLVMLGLFVLIGCKEEVIYSVDSKFLYSDNGRSGSYEEGVQEFYVGSRVYLMIEINYSATVKKEQMIEFDIIIPHAEHYDAIYFDGQKIEHDYDVFTQTITYSPKLIFGTEPKTIKLIFQFKPTQEGLAQITIDYPDIIDSSMDVQDTVQFVD